MFGLIENVFLPYFHKKGEDAIPFLVNSRVSRLAFLSAYEKLPPIEAMDEKEKKEMKKYIIDLFPNKTIQEKLEACKVVYALGTLL
jgi:hypothetical protein